MPFVWCWGWLLPFWVVVGSGAGLMLFLLFQICERLLVFGTVIACSCGLMGRGGAFSLFLLTMAFRGPCLYAFNGEFDPGSGRTLAACLTHASRTERPACGYSSGERVSNTWATCPQLWDNSRKRVLIPNIDLLPHGRGLKVFSAGDGPAAYQLVGGVMAYQGDDG